MRQKYHRFYASIVAVTTLADAHIVAAQKKPDKSAFMLEQITVTARKIPEDMQHTPISVAAYSSDTLEHRQIFGTDDLDQITVNLQFSNNAPLAGNNASSQVFIRGIGQTDPTAGVDPGVGLYIDDVYMGQSIGGTMDFRDIASVQVLRGPQGILFGRNTIGGAVVLTTIAPGEELGGKLRAGIGSDNLHEIFGAFDVPISDTLKSRFTAGKRVQDGYVRRVKTGEDLGDTNTYTLTGKLHWTPTSSSLVRLQFDYTKADENGSPLVFAASQETATFQRVASADAGCPGFDGDWTALPAVPLIDDERCANDFQNEGEFKNNGTAPLESKLQNWGTSLQAEYSFDSAITLKSITAYRELVWSGIRDADNTPLTILHTDYDSEGKQFSQELQSIYTSPQLTGVAGLYYFEEKIDDILTVVLNTPAPGEQWDSDNNLIENSSWAVFTQWTHDFSNTLSFTLGGRYTQETKGSTPDQFDYADPSVKYLPVKRYEEKFDAFTGSATASYHWTHTAMAYLSFSQGFKGGGWNSHFNRPQTQEELDLFHQFDEERADTWELGFKLDMADNTLRLNGAVFTTKYTDLQFVYRIGVAPYLANAGEATIKGFELESTWVPDDSWIVNTGISYLDDSIDKVTDIPTTTTSVTTANTLPYTPEWQANLGIGYTLTSSAGFSLSPRVDISYQDQTFFDTGNTTEIAQLDSVTLVNATIAVEPNGEQWRVVTGVNNATNEIYPIAGNSSLTTGSGYAEVAYARPREYFLNFSYDF